MNLFAIQLSLLVFGLSGALCQTTNESSFRNYENLTGIDDLVQLYDIHVLGAKWTEINVQLGRQCARDMTEYFNGLEKKASWAIKMDDSTGHYSAGYLWGNNFWTGSMTLCRSIYRYDETRLKKQIGHTGLGLVRGNMENYDDVHLNSPFIPHFGVVKFVLKEVFTTPNPRTVHIGVCLPSSCNASDLSHLAESAGRKTASETVTVIDARIPNGSGESLWNDWIFILMLTITVIVGLLITAGTVFDYQLKKKIKIETERKRSSKEAISESSGVNCTTYDLTQTVNGKESGGGMDICIPSGIGINNNGHLPMKPVTSRTTRDLSLGEEFLMSFSLTSNFEAICSRDVGDDTVSCIHGIRAISMCWIILGHTCYIGLNFADNSELRKVVEHQFVFQTIINGVYSVDTFFFISGFLVVFLYLRNNAKGNLDRLSQGVNEFTSTALHFCGLTSYRLARLTAPYLYMIGVTYVVMKYLADNMVFVPPGQDYINCPKYWWRNMLYINTFYPVQDMCMIWSWYLSNDTQFFIAGAIVLIIGVRHFKFATAALTLFLLSSWITTGVIDYSTETSDRFEFFDKIYDKPWTRFGPYLVGMAVGWILFKTNFKVQMSKFQKLLGWFISLSTLFVLVYGLYKIEMSKEVAAVHSAVSHTLWALGLAWVVIACATGNGGFINGLLSASCLYPFSRVTYCVYLVHPVVIRTFVVSSDTPFHLDEVSTLFIFFGQIGASYIASFAVSLGFEAPVCSLLRVMSKRSSRVVSTN